MTSFVWNPNEPDGFKNMHACSYDDIDVTNIFFLSLFHYGQ